MKICFQTNKLKLKKKNKFTADKRLQFLTNSKWGRSEGVFKQVDRYKVERWLRN